MHRWRKFGENLSRQYRDRCRTVVTAGGAGVSQLLLRLGYMASDLQRISDLGLKDLK